MIVRGAVSGVAGGSQITVLTYTNTTGADEFIRGIGLEGNARSEWEVQRNMTTLFKRRVTSPVAADEVPMFNFKLSNNDILDIKVIHYESFLAEFSADAIITPDKEGIANIIIKLVFPVELKGTVKNISKLTGTLNTTNQLNGRINNISKISGSFSQTISFNGSLEDKKKLTGAITCD